LRLKILKKLKTANLNSEFTGSNKKSVFYFTVKKNAVLNSKGKIFETGSTTLKFFKFEFL